MGEMGVGWHLSWALLPCGPAQRTSSSNENGAPTRAKRFPRLDSHAATIGVRSGLNSQSVLSEVRKEASMKDDVSNQADELWALRERAKELRCIYNVASALSR